MGEGAGGGVKKCPKLRDVFYGRPLICYLIHKIEKLGLEKKLALCCKICLALMFGFMKCAKERII
jgi:hypothetical protein